MYPCELSRSVTPDLADSVSESGSLIENSTIRANKVSKRLIMKPSEIVARPQHLQGCLPLRIFQNYCGNIMQIITWCQVSTSANENAGQSGRKSVKKTGLSIFFTARGCNWYCSTSSRRYTDFARASITRNIFIRCSMQP